jgi:putative phage-type endonuclease
MIAVDLQQGTEEWLKEKLGKPSASNCSKIITNDGKPSKQREGYLYELAGEVITQNRVDSYKNAAMEEGNLREQEAVDFFCMTNDCEIARTGVIYRDEDKKFLCSPDGIIVGKNEGFECKNPLPKTQVKYLLDGGLPSEYFGQVQFSLYVTGFDAWHFLSYVPAMRPVYLKVKRDEKFLVALDAELKQFILDLETVVNKIK